MADSHGISTDGVTYFAQLRSVIFDRDLDVAAEFAYLGQPPRPNHVVPIGPGAAVAAALPGGRGRRRAGSRAGALARAGRCGDDRARPALRARGAPLVVRDRRRRAVRRAVAPAPQLRSRPWPSSPRAGVRRDAALLVHGLRAVDDARRVVRLRRAVRRAVGAVACSPRRMRSLACTPEERFGVPDARRRWFSARCSASRSSRDRRSRSSPSSRGCWCSPRPACRQRTACAGRCGWPAGRCWARCRGSCCSSGTATCSSRVTSTTCSGRRVLQSAALALDRHAVLVVARLPVVDAGGLPRRHRHLRLPAARMAMGRGRRCVILFLTAWVNGATQDWAGGWSFGGRRFSSALVMLAPGPGGARGTRARGGRWWRWRRWWWRRCGGTTC